MATYFIILQSLGNLNAQQFIERPDTINKSRLIGVSSSVAAVWAGSFVGLYQVWYKQETNGKFRFFDDCNNWMQMDKAGHFYTANKLTQLNYDLFHWTGLSENQSTWVAGGISLGFQTTLEVFDGFSEDWGYSWCDMGANVLGTASFVGQQMIWHEQRIIPKFSYFPSQYAQLRPEILGQSFSESLLKDYNGQNYWLSASPGTFITNSSIPKWLCLSFGYGVDQKLVGDEDVYFDIINNRSLIASREYYLSLDIDFSKFTIRKPWLRTLVKQLNYIKVPFPAIGFSSNGVSAYWIKY